MPTGAEDGGSYGGSDGWGGGGPHRLHPADRVTHGGGEDRRLARPGARKEGVVGGGSGQMVHEVCRGLVIAATRGWRGGTAVNRQRVARLLETTEGTLGRMMAPSDPLAFRADHLQTLMTCEGAIADDRGGSTPLIPEAARFAAAAALAREWGGVFVPQAEVSAAGVQATVAAMGLAAASGKAADVLREVHEHCVPDGHGGCRISPAQGEELRHAAIAAEQSAAAVIQAVGG